MIKGRNTLQKITPPVLASLNCLRMVAPPVTDARAARLPASPNCRQMVAPPVCPPAKTVREWSRRQSKLSADGRAVREAMQVHVTWWSTTRWVAFTASRSR